jgi:hypothetical protein
VQFLGVEFLSLLRRALQFARRAGHDTVPLVQVGLAEVCGSCSCVAVSSFLGSRSPLHWIFRKVPLYPVFFTSLYRNKLWLPRCDIGEAGVRIRDFLNISLLPTISGGWHTSIELQMLSFGLKLRQWY